MNFKEKFDTASRYEIVAVSLGEHVKKYIPKGWKENIGSVDFIPRFLPTDAENFIKYFNENSLKDKLKENYKKWYIAEAIADFFKKGKHKKFVE